MLVHHFLENSARRTPHKTALICGERRLSFAQVDEAANRLANALLTEGVKRGDRVAIYMDNPVEVAIAIFATLKAGAVFSVSNPSTKGDKLARMTHDLQPAALITANDTQRRRVVAEMLPVAAVPLVVWLGGVPTAEASLQPTASVRFRDWDDLLSRGETTSPCARTIDLDLATIIYTSGSTGTPKGVMSTHRNMVFLAGSMNSYLQNSHDDVILCALPLAFGYGLYQLITCMQLGSALALERNFAFPYRAVEIMARERVTGFPGVPTMFALLLGLKDLAGYDLSHLRYITNAGAALPLRHLAGLRAALPHVKIYCMYGQTECQRVSYLPPEDVDRKAGSVGIAIPGTEVYIIDENGAKVGPGVTGELVVRGSHVMRGYWEKPGETAETFRPGPIPGETVLYTGDLFRMDEDGYLYFVSRRDDIIKTRGEKVAPKEMEDALYGMPGMREVAVIGVPDDTLGEAIKVFAVPEEGVTLSEREVRAFCARHFEDFMMPKYIEFLAALPKSGSGKIDKKELRACAVSPGR